ncbi:MAG: hypothetical protein GC180_08595 [Bacteroidetes bacterium]|nr:hypothetical protein [Bacteroidota bacterium]
MSNTSTPEKELTNTKFRGIRISPELKKDTIHYYVLVIDQPTTSGFDRSLVSYQAIAEGATSFGITYNGTLVDPAAGQATTTYLVGVYSDQKLANSISNELSMTITDNTNSYAKGNPNSGRPPVVKLVDTSDAYKPACKVLQSATNPPNFFVMFLVKTDYEQNGVWQIGEFFNQMIVGGCAPPETKTIIGNLVNKPGNSPVAAIGVISSSLDQFDNIKISGGEVITQGYGFNYDNPHSF